MGEMTKWTIWEKIVPSVKMFAGVGTCQIKEMVKAGLCLSKMHSLSTSCEPRAVVGTWRSDNEDIKIFVLVDWHFKSWVGWVFCHRTWARFAWLSSPSRSLGWAGLGRAGQTSSSHFILFLSPSAVTQPLFQGPVCLWMNHVLGLRFLPPVLAQSVRRDDCTCQVREHQPFAPAGLLLGVSLVDARVTAKGWTLRAPSPGG